MKRHIFVLSWSVFLSFLFPGLASAATYYVDWDLGTDAGGCGSQSSPCRTPWYTDGIASPGDTIIVHEKDDGSAYNNGNSVVIEVPSGTTWRAAPGNTVRLSISPIFGNCDSTVPQGSIVVSVGGDNSIFEGFDVWGQLHVSGNKNLIQNCDISGGVGARDDFISPIYIHGSSDSNRATGNHFFNNEIHDNCPNLATSNNYCNSNPSDQCPLVMSYYDEDTIFENCEFYNSNGPALRHKGVTYNVTVKESFFHDIVDGYGAMMGSEDGRSRDQNWHHNIIVGNGNSIAFSPKGVDPGYKYNIFNNVIYNTEGVSYWTGWIQVEAYNNIFYTTSSRTIAYSESGFSTARFDYLDYNQYYAISGNLDWFGVSGLSNWQQHLINQGEEADTRETNSNVNDPNFLPDDGVLDGSGPTDFKRSSYPTNGRGGSYPSVMGAFITGNEIIGLLGGQSTVYECNDTLDNDGDGSVDLADSGCSSDTDNDETDCGDGPCEGGEVCSSCPQDCLSGGEVCCSGSVYTGNCCSDPDCSGGEVCNLTTHTCEVPAPPQCTVNGDCSGGEICCSQQCVVPVCSVDGNCDDSDTCTTDSCSQGGTCSASCSNAPIAQCQGGDGCCPSGCTNATDSDCSPASSGLCSGMVLLHHYDNDPAYGESVSLVYDFSASDNNATCTACPAWNASGRFGGAFQYTGSEYFSAGNPQSLQLGDQDWSMSVWVYPTDLTGQQPILGKVTDAGYKEYGLRTFNTDFVVDIEENWNDAMVLGATSMQTNNWYHLAAVFNASSMNVDMYLDGSPLSTTGSIPSLPTRFSEPFEIGRWAYSSSYYNGLIDELIVWNRTLSASEISRIWSSGSPVSCGQTWHRADSDESCSIDMGELLYWIDNWHHDSALYPMHEMMEAIGHHYSGSYC